MRKQPGEQKKNKSDMHNPRPGSTANPAPYEMLGGPATAYRRRLERDESGRGAAEKGSGPRAAAIIAGWGQ